MRRECRVGFPVEKRDGSDLRYGDVFTGQRNTEAEATTFTLAAFDPCIAAVLARNTADDEQAETSPLDLAVLAAAQADIALKQPLLVFTADPKAGIQHGNDDLRVVTGYL